jgi:hypothetical protein
VGATLRPLILLVASAAACASDTGNGAGSEGEALQALPPTSVLCKVHEGHDPGDNQHDHRTYGTHVEDVMGVWGSPVAKDGARWTYEWCLAADCRSKATVSVIFENADLCMRNGAKVTPGQYVIEMHADGMKFQECWDPSIFNVADGQCPECTDTKLLAPCSS